MNPIPKLSFALLLSAAFVTTACSEHGATTSTTTEKSNMQMAIMTDVKVGEGAQATAGHMVSVHYTGWLYDEAAADHKGKKFDSSRDRGAPFEFPLGAGRVIKGWDTGVEGMKVGGQRTLVIPPNWATAQRGAGGVIPPNATLVLTWSLLGWFEAEN